MFCLDTSELLVYTLTQSVEEVRYAATRAFFAQVKSGALSGATSFHALHEVHLFALANAPDHALRDPADVSHAIAAWVAQCEAIVTYDSHFKAIAQLIPYRTPEDFLA